MRSDTDFDGLAATFEEDVYGSSKGYVRLSVLWDDLVAEIPRLKRGGLRVLDAGGGSGRIAVRLAKLGNEIVLCDPSSQMLDMARQRIGQETPAGRVMLVHSSIQDLPDALSDKFDVVLCHAVLEWLGNPENAVRQLVGFLKPDGSLSLMFYNRNAALLKQIVRGQLADALEECGGESARQTERPVPLDEAVVRGWLEAAGLTVRSKAGIRIFHDYLAAELVERNLEELIEIEKTMRKSEPFASLGQHIHLVCRRGNDV